jgi:hypothetical protein
MSEPIDRRGNGLLIVGWIVAFLLVIGTFVAWAPIAKCPFCPFVSPYSLAKPGCPKCDDRGRVSLYRKWKIERSLSEAFHGSKWPGR